MVEDHTQRPKQPPTQDAPNNSAGTCAEQFDAWGSGTPSTHI